MSVTERDPLETVKSGSVIKLYKGNSYKRFWAFDGSGFICRFFSRHAGGWKEFTTPNPFSIESDIEDGYNWEAVSVEDSPFERTDLSATDTDSSEEQP